jgi:hypothetical protein
MRGSGRSLVAVLLLTAVPVLAARAQSRAGALAAADTARRMVQRFYDWYLPLTEDADGDGSAWMRAVRERGSLFAREIVDGLRADSAAAADDDGEIAGLDGDPFLDAQDPCDSYQVRRVRADGDAFLVEVLGEGGCETHGGPDVIVVVERRDGRWVFADFRYPGPPPRDLLGVLKRQGAPADAPSPPTR